MANDLNGGTEPPAPTSLESDLSKLAALLSEPNTEANEEDIATLLQKLEAANGIAAGVEDKLDGILDHLDGLLNSMEPSGGDKIDDAKAGE